MSKLVHQVLIHLQNTQSTETAYFSELCVGNNRIEVIFILSILYCVGSRNRDVLHIFLLELIFVLIPNVHLGDHQTNEQSDANSFSLCTTLKQRKHDTR